MQIDLNCDLGEGYPHDAELMALITSANVACGGHAGDEATMRATIELAKAHGVQVGAHPSHPDRANFGRVELARPTELVLLDCLAQIDALRSIALAAGAIVRYVKPHGALYNQACRDATMAQAVAHAAMNRGLAVMGLSGSVLESVARKMKLRFIAEGFADRRYRADGSLVPRARADALIEDPQEASEQAERLARTGSVQTICVHGDNPQAVGCVRLLRERMTASGITIKPFDL